jgi:hypothetical protein
MYLLNSLLGLKKTPLFSERKDNFYKLNYQLFFYKKVDFFMDVIKQKTIPINRDGFKSILKIFYSVLGNKIRYCPRLTPLKFDPYFALIASKNLLAINAYPFGLG